MSAAEQEDQGTGDEIRDRLLAAATEVILREGYAGCRMQDVAAAAGLSTGAIYNRFRGKAELFAALLRPRSADEIAARLAQDASDAPMSDAVDRVLARLRSSAVSERDSLMVEAFIGARRDSEAVGIAAERLESIDEINRSVLEVVQAKEMLAEGVEVADAAALWTVVRLGLGVLDRSGAGRATLGEEAIRALVGYLTPPDDR